MPCGCSTDNFPAYLNTIIKAALDGDDDEKKNCACTLTIPTRADGTLITDRDGKNGAFPFCLTIGVPPSTGQDSNYPFSMNMADFSWLIWQAKKIKLTAKQNSWVERGDCGRRANASQTNDGVRENNSPTPSDPNDRICEVSLRDVSTSIAGRSNYYWPSTNPCCGNPPDCPKPYDIGYNNPISIVTNLNSTYITESGDVWMWLDFDNAFSLLPCGNTKPRVQMPPGIKGKMNVNGKSFNFPKIYFCWFPAWHNDSGWSWSGNVKIDVEVKE